MFKKKDRIKNQTECPAILKNGDPCPYRGKPEYQGYCGHHKQFIILKPHDTGNQKDKKIVLLLSAGVALIELTIKAVEYLPTMIEIIDRSKFMCFIEKNQGEINSKQEEVSSMDDQIKFLISPKNISKDISRMLEEQEFGRLANMLAYDFDVTMTSGKVPSNLLIAIISKKQELQSLLATNGYSPGDHTVPRPLFSQVIEN
ncbi:hypothetical protein ELY33_10995 [Vreelandella andesensis]|uniref:Uncharacterized protein n=1 Tax=Vreelandella andesensis TaxID=447567 RepID=A0A433KLH8_9GAMM|nr:hypothetical protein [Halomonas andesensis]RUR30325.1 hypothetical protein ELY33_10995 [Halomonas andesensis]